MNLKDLKAGDVVLITREMGAVTTRILAMVTSAAGDVFDVPFIVTSGGTVHPLRPEDCTKVTFIEMTEGEVLSLE